VEIEELLVNGEVEIAVIPHGTQPSRHRLLDSEVLCQRRWHLVLRADHPLARKRKIRAADLVRYPWVLADPQGNDWAKAVTAGLARAGVLDRLDLAVRVDDSMTACHLASLGLGLTVTPYKPLSLSSADVCIRPLDELFPTDHLVAMWRRGAPPRAAARVFLDFVRCGMADA
jgi:DNA-binding transcriptional LysR family regulator